jgi:hypothetical protein
MVDLNSNNEAKNAEVGQYLMLLKQDTYLLNGLAPEINRKGGGVCPRTFRHQYLIASSRPGHPSGGVTLQNTRNVSNDSASDASTGFQQNDIRFPFSQNLRVAED